MKKNVRATRPAVFFLACVFAAWCGASRADDHVHGCRLTPQAALESNRLAFAQIRSYTLATRHRATPSPDILAQWTEFMKGKMGSSNEAHAKLEEMKQQYAATETMLEADGEGELVRWRVVRKGALGKVEYSGFGGWTGGQSWSFDDRDRLLVVTKQRKCVDQGAFGANPLMIPYLWAFEEPETEAWGIWSTPAEMAKPDFWHKASKCLAGAEPASLNGVSCLKAAFERRGRRDVVWFHQEDAFPLAFETYAGGELSRKFEAESKAAGNEDGKRADRFLAHPRFSITYYGPDAFKKGARMRYSVNEHEILSLEPRERRDASFFMFDPAEASRIFDRDERVFVRIPR